MEFVCPSQVSLERFVAKKPYSCPCTPVSYFLSRLRAAFGKGPNARVSRTQNGF
jgi:hypothetical protein